MVVPSTVASRLDGETEPIRLKDWRNDNVPSNSLTFGPGSGQQCQFVLDNLGSLFVQEVPSGRSLQDVIDNVVYVVSTHASKSVKLPVFRLIHPNGGLELVMRNNFHNWQVSVISSRPVEDIFYGLFNTMRKVDAVYCEGFDPAWVFGSYENDQQRFTVTLSDDFTLFTFLWLLTKSRKS